MAFLIARPDSVRHMRIGHIADAGLAGVANVLLQPFDFLIAAGQVQRDLFYVAVVVVGYVPDLQASGFDALLDGDEVSKSCAAGSGLDVEVVDTHLFNPDQIVGADGFVHLHRDFDAGREWLKRGGFRRCVQRRRDCHGGEASPCHFHDVNELLVDDDIASGPGALLY